MSNFAVRAAGSLNTETKVIILQTLVANGGHFNMLLQSAKCFASCGRRTCHCSCNLAGNGLWLNKTKSQCLVLWKKLPDWAKEIYQWAQSVGLEQSVTTVDEISQGEDCRGTGDVGLCILHDKQRLVEYSMLHTCSNPCKQQL